MPVKRPMNQFLRRLLAIEARRETLEGDEEDLLRTSGWTRSSDYPGSLWLWSKEFPESPVQWVWKGTEKVPHPGFTINGAPTHVAMQIEAAWQDVWIKEEE